MSKYICNKCQEPLKYFEKLYHVGDDCQYCLFTQRGTECKLPKKLQVCSCKYEFRKSDKLFCDECDIDYRLCQKCTKKIIKYSSHYCYPCERKIRKFISPNRCYECAKKISNQFALCYKCRLEN